MKIAHFTDTFYPKVDGITTSIINFSKELIRQNHKIILFCPKYNSHKELKMKGLFVNRFFSFSLPSYKEVKIVTPNIIKILRLIQKHKPDVIHIHTPGPMGCIGILCSKIYKIPCLGTYNTLVSEQLMYLSLKKLLKIEKLLIKISELKLINRLKKNRAEKEFCCDSIAKSSKHKTFSKGLAWKLSCGIYNNCHLVIVPSKSIKNLLKEKGIKREIEVISYGIDTNLFNPKKRYNKKIRKIIQIGRLSFEKNIDQTIQAFSFVAKKYKHVKYIIIGNGPALDSLKNLSRKLGLTKQIKFLGYMPRNNLPRYYKDSDFFLTASAMETLGLVILEAMASGIPVIGVDAFAIPEIVKNGFNGFIVQPTDIKGMANYMELLIKNPKLVKTLGKNALISAKSHNLKKTSKLLGKTYKKLINIT